MKVKKFELGATGRFPQGKIDESDEGELRAAISTDTEKKLVRLDFGKRLSWLALPPDDARSLACELMERANALTPRPPHPEDAAFDAAGQPMNVSPAGVRDIVDASVTRGKLLLAVLEHDGNITAHVMGDPSQDTLDALEKTAAAMRKILATKATVM